VADDERPGVHLRRAGGVGDDLSDLVGVHDDAGGDGELLPIVNAVRSVCAGSPLRRRSPTAFTSPRTTLAPAVSKAVVRADGLVNSVFGATVAANRTRSGSRQSRPVRSSLSTARARLPPRATYLCGEAVEHRVLGPGGVGEAGPGARQGRRWYRRRPCRSHRRGKRPPWSGAGPGPGRPVRTRTLDAPAVRCGRMSRGRRSHYAESGSGRRRSTAKVVEDPLAQWHSRRS